MNFLKAYFLMLMRNSFQMQYFKMVEKYHDNFAINDEINRISIVLGELINSTTYLLQNKYGINKYERS